jgi:hypothetical protein
MLTAKQTEYKQQLRDKEKELAKKFAVSDSDNKRYQADIAASDANFNTVARELGFNQSNLEALLYGHNGPDGKFQPSQHGAPLVNTMVSIMADIASSYPNFGKLNPSEKYQLLTVAMNKDPGRLKTIVSYVSDKYTNSHLSKRMEHERKKWAEEIKKQGYANVASPGLVSSPNGQSQNPLQDGDLWQ